MSVCAFTALRVDIARASDVGDADRVLATELFREGRSLLAEKRYAEACRKLEESERLDPGGGTLLNLALCHELEGRSAMAWSEFHEAVAVARRDGRDDREDEARRHIEALEPRLARLTIAVAPSAQLPELTVRLDGGLIRAPAWGAAIPIERGAHVVDVEAPGRLAWRASIEVEDEGASKTVEVPRLEPVPAPAPLPALGPMIAPPRALLTAPLVAEPPAPTWQRALALGVGGLGLLGVALGAVTGLEARSQWADAQLHCLGGTCDAQGWHAWNASTENAARSTVAFVLGTSAVTGGVILWLAAPVARDVRAGAPTPIGPAILVGAGVASLTAGASFGLHSFAEKKARDAGCSAGACSAAALTHDADAMSSATFSTVAVAAGLALAAAGGAWFFVDRSLARLPEKSSRVRSSGPWVLGALGLASVAAGAYLGMRALDDKRARDAACPTGRGGCSPAALRDDADGRATATLSDVMFGAGAITLAGGAALWLYGTSRHANSGSRWGAVPMLARQSMGLLFEGDIE